MAVMAVQAVQAVLADEIISAALGRVTARNTPQTNGRPAGGLHTGAGDVATLPGAARRRADPPG